MSSLSILLVVSALAASDKPASLSFVSNDRLLVGTVYGISAIDADRQAYGKLLSADVSAGHRTVWYSCPNAPQPSEGSRITFDFVAGQRYELVCQASKQAMIRPAEGC